MSLNLMNWENCKKDFVRKVYVDNEKIKSIIKMCELREEFLEKQKVDDRNVSFILEGYYEIIKEFLVAYLLKNGLRSKNHQCLISYFYKENPEYESETYLISRLCYLRNRATYYGERMNLSFYEQNIDKIIKIIKLLKEKILK